MKYIRKLLFFAVIASFFAACDLDDGTEELQLEHDQALAELKTHFGVTENDSIGDGIYLLITSPTDEADTIFPEGDDYIVVDLTGMDSDLDVFHTTLEEEASLAGIERSDFIYGPVRIKVENTFPGFYKAIQKVPEGAEATMIFPHDQAFGAYEPIVYKVKLYRVIDDITSYVSGEFDAYRQALGIGAADTLSGIDSVYVKTLVYDTTQSHDIYYGDIVTIRLHAHYVEMDSAYVDWFPGREFFPINESGDSIEFQYGNSAFPITELIHAVIPAMNIGDTWEILGPAKYAYGAEGFIHPIMGNIIVPVDMPVHYTIKLVGYR